MCSLHSRAVNLVIGVLGRKSVFGEVGNPARLRAAVQPSLEHNREARVAILGQYGPDSARWNQDDTLAKL